MSKSDKENNDWGRLSNLWKGAPVPDISDLVKKIQAKTIRMRVVFIVESLAGLLGCIFGLYVMVSKNTPLAIGTGALAVTVTLFAVYFNWWVRKDIWKADSSSSKDQMKLMYKRANASIKYALFNLWGCGLGFTIIGFFFFLGWLGYLDINAEKLGRLILLFYAVLIYILMVALGSYFYLKKNKKESKTYKSILNSLESEDNEEDAP